MESRIVNKNDRVEYIDLFRAAGIILMIMGHISFGSCFGKWIHGFHMPMFFFVSGWFFRSGKPVAAEIGKKARRLLLPYLCFELLQWLLLMIFIPTYRTPGTLYYIFLENSEKIQIESGTFGISPIPGAMWFLTAIFFVEVVYILLDKALGCSWKLHASVVLLVALGMAFPKLLPFRLPWSLDAAFVCIGFFHVARMMRNSKAERLLELKWWQTLLSGLLFSGLIMVCPGINVRTGSYGWYLPFWINALGAIVTGWNAARFAERFLSRWGILKPVSGWLKGIGMNSVVYLCFNQTVILAAAKLMDLAGIGGLIAKIPILILTMLFLFGLEKLICNTKLKVMIGK